MEVDRGFEVFGIAEAAGAALDRHALAVETLGHGVGNEVRAVYVITFSRRRWIIAATFFTGSRRLRLAHWYHWPKNRLAQPGEV